MDPWVYEAGPKAMLYAALFLALGSAVAYWLLVSNDADDDVRAMLCRIARCATMAVVAAFALRVVAHCAAVFGPQAAIAPSKLHLILFESRWGRHYCIPFGLGLLFIWLALKLGAKRRRTWTIFGICGMAIAATLPLTGHAAGSYARWVLHAVHIIAGASWLGALAAFLLVMPADGGFEPTLRRFSRLALCAAPTVAATGAIAAIAYVGTWANLATSVYGRLLFAKLLLFGAVLACGWNNWRRVRMGGAPIRSVLVAEVVFACAVLALTGVLTETAHP